MANNIGYCTTNKLSSTHIAKVSVPSGGLVAGNIVLLNDLDNTITNNFEVYSATKPLTANLEQTHFAIIQNGGFETMSDGRRPEGQPDFTQYSYLAGEVATAVFVDPHLTFEIGCTTVTGGTAGSYVSDIGKFIIPADSTYVGVVSASNADIGNSLKIVAVKYLPLGGNFGLDYAQTYVCVAQ
ncbi:MAG: hypothetical protein WC240_05175 [Bacilli bacterium]|jgi:hypothetical protein